MKFLQQTAILLLSLVLTVQAENCTGQHCNDIPQGTNVGGASSTGGGSGAVQVDRSGMSCRYCNDPPKEHDVSVHNQQATTTASPTNAQSDAEGINNGNLIQTTCRPDDNGYVGVAEGYPNVVPYAFGLEIAPEAVNDIVDILRAIKLSVENTLIRQYFPEVCLSDMQSAARSSLEGGGAASNQRITGFRFEAEMDRVSIKCEPLVSPTYVCGIYEAFLEVFGANEDEILALVQRHLNGNEMKHVHDEIARIFATDSSGPTYQANATQIPPPTYQISESSKDDDTGLSSGAIAGIIISVTVLLVGTVGLLMVRRNSSRKVDSVTASISDSNIYLEQLDAPEVQVDKYGRPIFTPDVAEIS